MANEEGEKVEDKEGRRMAGSLVIGKSPLEEEQGTRSELIF